jgi:hypothetical protein
MPMLLIKTYSTGKVIPDHGECPPGQTGFGVSLTGPGVELEDGIINLRVNLTGVVMRTRKSVSYAVCSAWDRGL